MNSAILALVLCVVAIRAREFRCDVYVAHFGNDTNADGSKERPYRSIERATTPKNTTNTMLVVCVGGNIVFCDTDRVTIQWNYFGTIIFKAEYWDPSQTERPILTRMQFNVSTPTFYVGFIGIDLTMQQTDIVRLSLPSPRKSLRNHATNILLLNVTSKGLMTVNFLGRMGSIYIHDSIINRLTVIRGGMKSIVRLSSSFIQFAELHVPTYYIKNSYISDMLWLGMAQKITVTNSVFNRKLSVHGEKMTINLTNNTFNSEKEWTILYITTITGSVYLENNTINLIKPIETYNRYSSIIDVQYYKFKPGRISVTLENQDIDPRLLSTCLPGYKPMNRLVSCKPCGLGKTSQGGNGTCFDCPAGTEGRLHANSRCIPCQLNEFSEQGSYCRSCKLPNNSTQCITPVIEKDVSPWTVFYLSVLGPIAITIIVVTSALLYDSHIANMNALKIMELQ